MKIIFIIYIFFTALTINAQQSLEGTWNTGQDNTNIEISEKGGVYQGIVVSSDNDKVTIGKQFLKDIKLVDGKWKGKMYSPKKDKWFDAILEGKEDQLWIQVKAGMMSKTLEWKKV